MKIRTKLLIGLLIFALAGAGAAPAQAGILDSIGGIFKKGIDAVKGLFGGGSKSSDTASESELTQFLDQLEQSQAAVQEKQQAAANLAQGGSLDPANATVQAKLDEVAAASRENEQLYTNFLKVRAQIKGSDTEKQLAERLTRVQESQHVLEQNAQELEKLKNSSGFYKPTGSGATQVAGALWDDPRAKGYIDEWLAGSGLDEYGRYVQPAHIAAAGQPELSGKSRHHWVWENLKDQSGASGMTLEQYVRARMNGQAPAAAAAVAAADAGDASTVGGTPASSGGSSSGAATADGRAAPVDVSATVAQVDSSLKVAMARFEELSKDSEKAQSQEAKDLLATITALKERKNELIRLQSQ